MSLLSDIGGSLVTSLTGVDPATLQAEVGVATQALQMAVEVQIALTAIMSLELLLIVVLLWREKS